LNRERIQGDSYSYSSDIWSFGLTMLAVAKGRFPLEDAEEFADAGAANATMQTIKAKSGKHFNEMEAKWNTETGGQGGPFASNAGNGEMEGTGGYWGMIRAICELSPPTPGPSFSEEFNHFIGVCLRKDPEERYTARALLFDSFASKELEDEVDYRNDDAGSELGSPDQGSRKRFSRPSSGKPVDESPFSQSVKMSLEKRGSRDREATMHQAADTLVHSATHSAAASPARSNAPPAKRGLGGPTPATTAETNYDSAHGSLNVNQNASFDLFNPDSLTVIDAIRLKHLEHIITKLIAREKQLIEELNNPDAGGKPLVMRIDSINSYAESMEDDMSADDLFWKSAIDVGGMSPAKYSSRQEKKVQALRVLSTASNDDQDSVGGASSISSIGQNHNNHGRPPNVSPSDQLTARDTFRDASARHKDIMGSGRDSVNDEGLTEEQLRSRFQGHHFAPNASFQRLTSRTPAPAASMPMMELADDINKWDYLADQLRLPIHVVRIVADAKIQEMLEQQRAFYSRDSARGASNNNPFSLDAKA
jgi:serine/threonine protein kinase